VNGDGMPNLLGAGVPSERSSAILGTVSSGNFNRFFLPADTTSLQRISVASNGANLVEG